MVIEGCPLIIGHRANTAKWLRRYMKEGADGVEIDVYEDNGRVRVGHPLDKSSPVLLRERVARILTGTHIKRGLELKEILDLIGGRILWIDLKDPGMFSLLPERERLLSLGQNLVFTTRFHDEVRKIKELYPRSKVLLSIESLPPELPEVVRRAEGDGISIKFDIIEKRAKVIDDLKLNGLLTAVWVVNRKECMERVVNWGVNYIVTELVDLALRICKEKKVKN